MMNLRKDPAVSDVIGVILLISVATVAIGIVAVQLISEFSVNQVPNADIIITSNGGQYYFHMERGDSLDRDRTSIIFRNDDTGSTEQNDSPLIKFYNETGSSQWDDKICGDNICPFNASSTIIAARPGGLAGKNIAVMIQYNATPGNPMILKSATFPWWVNN